MKITHTGNYVMRNGRIATITHITEPGGWPYAHGYHHSTEGDKTCEWAWEIKGYYFEHEPNEPFRLDIIGETQ